MGNVGKKTITKIKILDLKSSRNSLDGFNSKLRLQKSDWDLVCPSTKKAEAGG